MIKIVEPIRNYKFCTGINPYGFGLYRKPDKQDFITTQFKFSKSYDKIENTKMLLTF